MAVWNGAVAQLGERLPCTQEVSGSIPLSSTTSVVVTVQREVGARRTQTQATGDGCFSLGFTPGEFFNKVEV